MEDVGIIALYFRRDERAILESDKKYGVLCRRIAMNVLSVREDAEECVNDTWQAAWSAMPPQKPGSLGAFLGRITRNLSISRFRADRAQKRGGGMEILLSELDECVAGGSLVDRELERSAIAEIVSRWLDGLPAGDRTLFVRRYWYGDSLKALAGERESTADRLAQKMMRLRQSLRTALESEGVEV